MHPGDILNPAFFPHSEPPVKLARIVNMEHIIWDIGDKITHKLLVFTEEGPGTGETRLLREN